MKFDKTKYEDHKDSLERIDESFRILEKLFISLGIDYTNKISGTYDNKHFFMFRDSVLHRMGAALFHYDLLSKVNNSGTAISYASKNSPRDGYYVTLQSSYLFDSIIFHTMSAFDYYAGLIKFVSDGKPKSWKVTWGEMIGITKHIPLFLESPLGQHILYLNKNFITSLIGYRSGLIHNKIESPRFRQSSDLTQSKVTVFPPDTFIKLFKNQLEGNKDYNLHEVTLWLLETAINGIVEMLKNTSKYFEDNRKIGPENGLIYVTPKLK